jgi:hypothetical protein
MSGYLSAVAQVSMLPLQKAKARWVAASALCIMPRRPADSGGPSHRGPYASRGGLAGSTLDSPTALHCYSHDLPPPKEPNTVGRRVWRVHNSGGRWCPSSGILGEGTVGSSKLQRRMHIRRI